MNIFFCYFHGNYLLLCLYVYCSNMNFNKSFSLSFLLPFINYPLTSLFVTLIPVLSTAITMSSLSRFIFGSRFIFIFDTLHHQVVVKSGTISWSLFICSDIVRRKPSNCRYGSRYMHVRWRAVAISRNSDSDNLRLPFLCSFSLILLANSVKNLNQIAFLLV